MASSTASLLLSALLLPAVKGEAFSHVQPLNTTILGQYGYVDPVYPSPNATGVGGWSDALAKAQAFVNELTLAEKSQMVTGVPGPCVGNILAIDRLGFPGLCLQDGPLAIRVASYASVFSAGVSAAASWDRDLMYERGYAMGEEFRGKGAHIYLGPVAGPLGRSGYAGRNWEGFAADPYLTGVAMEQTITGVQDTGVQSCAKHFVAYEQETQRNPTYPYVDLNDNNISVTAVTQEAVSSNVDDRTLHEIYAWPFANAVHAGVSSLMCSYNRINGSYACQNSKTLNGLLKTELGFQGYVMSDWGGTHSGMASIESGLDMNMPGDLGSYGDAWGSGSFFGGNVTTAVNNGTLDVSRLDDMILRIMTPYYLHGQDSGYPGVDPSGGLLNTFSPVDVWRNTFNMTGEYNVDVRGNHSQLIRQHGAAGTVLLKNTNNALPLKAPKLIAVFGNDASFPDAGMYTNGATFYGNQYVGGGSGTGRATFVSTPLNAIIERSSQDNAYVQFFLNNTYVIDSEMPDLWIPAQPDVCLVFVKTYAEEGADRTTLDLDWDASDMVDSVAKYCNNTVVVSHSSGINMLPFADNDNVTAILAAHYPGEESGHAIVDVLYGDVNPSGHLPYTIAYNSTDYNAPPTTAVQTNGTEDWQAWFDEELEIDYRYFDANNISVRYEFGFGLSYTTFELANIASEALGANFTSAPPAEAILPGGNPALWESLYNVTVSVSNTGALSGAAVPQLYITFPDSAPAGTPPKQLRGFDKITLSPNETQTVSFELMRRDISYWDIISQEWLIPSGDIGISVGFSSRDLRVSTTIAPVSE
ncbi:beta-glucosidase-related glycosidase [Coniella lustricola]|uniref:Beta-glucosidase cel3A n=1 Tax=Coniella lustricola TaxID=2025994 RepID=A0A2T3AJL0_9PEZI|nr:beta-glucosidase-related glycosidase [Coniella lustricola]